MPEWLNESLSTSSTASPLLLAWRIGAAILLGGAVAGIYRWARRGETVPATFLTTLVLLSTIIAMSTQVIGDNVARAFSLVGALSVVRFRTVVKDTQDTAFVIFAVVVGMAAGANHLSVALVGLALVGVASLVLWPRPCINEWASVESILSLRITFADGVHSAVEQFLTTVAQRSTMISVSIARQGACLDLTYRVRLRSGYAPATVVAELNLMKGVENVELKRD